MKTSYLKLLRFKCAVGHGINDIYWFLLPSILPLIIDRFGLRYRSGGLILTAYLMVIALFSTILGKWSDSVDRQRILGFGFILSAIGMTLAGIMDSMTAFVVPLLVAAVGTSSFHPVGLALIDETAHSRRGVVFGFFEFWGFLAVCVMFFLNSVLLKKFEWQSIIIFMGSSGFFMAFPFLFRKEHHGFNHTNEQENPSSFQNEGSTQLLILFLVTITLRFFSITAIINFMTTFLVHEIEATPGVANLMAGFVFLGGMLFTPLFGVFSDRFKPMNLFLITTGLCAPAIVLLSLPSSAWIITILLFLAGIIFYGSSPPMDILLSRLSGTIGKGQAFGYIMSVFAVITALSPALFGMLADRVGLRAAFELFAIPPFISFFVLLYTDRKMGRNR